MEVNRGRSRTDVLWKYFQGNRSDEIFTINCYEKLWSRIYFLNLLNIKNIVKFIRILLINSRNDLLYNVTA